MKDVFKEIEVNGVKYPIVFNINVIEVMQEQYGSITEWAKIFEGEPRLKDVIFTFKECINEGIDIENEKNNANRPFLTLKQTGRILHTISDITTELKNLVTESNETGNEKNVITEQNPMENN